MPAIMGNNLKRVRVFIKPNGEVIEGGIEAALGNNMGYNVGGASNADRLPEQSEKTEKETENL
jgi:hypothetical protein